MTPLVAISMGDPAGIGPEVLVRALARADVRDRAAWVIAGDDAVLASARDVCGVGVEWRTLTAPDLPSAPLPRAGEVVLLQRAPAGGRSLRDLPAQPTAEGGRASLDFVHASISLAQRADAWRADAIVTAPISKEAWVLAGETRFPGHTELFADAFASPHAAMMFAAAPAGGHKPGLHVILVTAHVPLSRVPAPLTSERIAEVIALGASAMERLGFARPRVGVCGLNPHAGEHGVLGTEDDAIIAPAIARARSQGIDATGPFPADTIYPGVLTRESAGGIVRGPRLDLVVAMYHDQGLIPVKLLAFDRAVNMTVGLTHAGRSVLRTSPDHGTAYDIAGTGKADDGSMAAALLMATRTT